MSINGRLRAFVITPITTVGHLYGMIASDARFKGQLPETWFLADVDGLYFAEQQRAHDLVGKKLTIVTCRGAGERACMAASFL